MGSINHATNRNRCDVLGTEKKFLQRRISYQMLHNAAPESLKKLNSFGHRADDCVSQKSS